MALMEIEAWLCSRLAPREILDLALALDVDRIMETTHH